MRRCRRFCARSESPTNSPEAEKGPASGADKRGCGSDKAPKQGVVSILWSVAAPAQRRRALGRIVVLGLYVLVALVAPLLHHDFECHLKSRLHCDACTASPAASSIEAGVTLFVHVGPLRASVPESDEARSHAEPPASPGRAPPFDASLV